MKKFKPKKFGKVIAFNWLHNGTPCTGVSIKFESGRMEDEFDGEWIKRADAKRLYDNLGRALAYLENPDQ